MPCPTSPVLTALMDAMAPVAPTGGPFSTNRPDVAPGSVGLQAHLACEDGRWLVSLSVRTPEGCAPVRDLWHLADHVRTGSYHSYGPAVGFRHDLKAFDPRSREVLAWLADLQRARAGAGLFSAIGQADGLPQETWEARAPLAPAELVELLDIHGEFDGPLLAAMGGPEAEARVLREDPEVTAHVAEQEDGSLALWLERPVVLVRTEERLYLWQDGSFHKCSHDFAAVADLLQALAQAPRLTVAAQDRPRFCATLLPLLERHCSVDLPRSVLAEYLEGRGQGDAEAGLQGLVDSFRSAAQAPCPDPAGLEAELRPYQREGLRWMNMLCDMGCGGVLADEMGLGKTVQVIALVLARAAEARGAGPALVVCPSSLVYTWQSELARFAPSLRVEALTGPAEARARRLARHPDVALCSYDVARLDRDLLAAARPWLMVLDEAQYIKSPGAKTTLAVKSIPANHVLALTGTPIENRPAELWSLFDCVMPGYLGTFRQFRRRFGEGILAGSAQDAEALHRLVSPFLLRRTKAQVAGHLPQKLQSTVPVELGAEERAAYERHAGRLREALAQEGPGAAEGRGAEVLGELTRLRELCCWPGLVEKDFAGGSAKADAILQILDSGRASGERALVFSQFTGFLDLLGERLEADGVPYFRLDGGTPKRRRQELVDQFNTGDVPVFLISLKAGGTGLTLTGASLVVHADPWWNQAEEDQATDRAHRIGQTHEVKVYKVIARDTVEERVLELQRKKAQLSDELVNREGTDLASLPAQDLLGLLEESQGAA